MQKAIIKHTRNAIVPPIEIVDTGQYPLFNEDYKKRIEFDVSKAKNFLGLNRLKSPKKIIDDIVKKENRTGRTRYEYRKSRKVK